MKVTLMYVKVFGLEDQYGKKPRTPLPDSPITIEDYPKKDDIAEIHLGSIPNYILRAYQTRRAIGKYELSFLAPNPEFIGKTPDEIIELILSRNPSSFGVERWNWYITLIIRRDIDIVSDCNLLKRKYFWLDPFVAKDRESSFSKEISAYIRYIELYLGVIDSTFIKETVLESVFFFSDNRVPFGLPKTSSSAHGIVIRTQEDFPLTQLQNNLKTMKELIKQYGELKSAIHWYIEAHKEADTWKKYFWLFQSLEIFTAKLSTRFFHTVRENREKLSSLIAHMDIDNRERKDELDKLMDPKLTLKEFNHLKLWTKFLVVSLQLRPETVKEDIKIFQKVKRIRNQMAHGVLDLEEETIYSNQRNLEMLIRKYLSTLLNYIDKR